LEETECWTREGCCPTQCKLSIRELPIKLQTHLHYVSCMKCLLCTFWVHFQDKLCLTFYF
jgi:hypothetical protein